MIGRHAVSIDERRAFFRTNLWFPHADDGGPVDLKQVWFPGAHCDVGGGYPESQSGLSKGALEWMLGEAVANGLLIDRAKVDLVLGRVSGPYVKPNPNGKLHNSLKPWWWPCEFILKRHYSWKLKQETYRMNLFRRRTMPEGAMVHDSAFERKGDYAKRLPPSAVRVHDIPI